MVGVALSPREASVVKVTVLLLAAIAMVGAFRSALGAVHVKVAAATPVPADESLGAGPVGAVGIVVYTHSPAVDSLAGRPFDGTGAIERCDVRRVAGAGRI
jgi:hypothetical protein